MELILLYRSDYSMLIKNNAFVSNENNMSLLMIMNKKSVRSKEDDIVF